MKLNEARLKAGEWEMKKVRVRASAKVRVSDRVRAQGWGVGDEEG